MAIGQHLIAKLLESIKEQLPTLTEEDIITALNTIYIACTQYNDITNTINIVTRHYQEQDENFNAAVFRKNLHYSLQYIDQVSLFNLRSLISITLVNNIFHHPLLVSEFSEFVRKNITNIQFIKMKIAMIKTNNTNLIKEINSCTNLNKLNKFKEQLANDFEILKHFKSICENHQLKVLNVYNFAAKQMKYFVTDEEHHNAIVLTANEYRKIKEIVAREDKFKNVLIASNDAEVSYQLNVEELNKVFREDIINLLDEYELKIAQIKDNKAKIIEFKIKTIKLKMQNILDLSQAIFDVFQKPVELLPLTKVVNSVFDETDSTNYLSEMQKDVDNNIKMSEILNKQLQTIFDKHVIAKRESLVQIENMNIYYQVDTKTTNFKKRKKKKSQSKQIDLTKPTNNIEVNNVNETVINSKSFFEETITKINTLLEENKVDVKAQVINEKTDNELVVKESLKQDDTLKTKVNELETQLKLLQIELFETKIKSSQETTTLKQQLIVEKEKVQILNNETKLLVSKINDLTSEKKKLEIIKQKNSIKIKNIFSDLAKVQKKVRNIRDQKNKSIEKWREQEVALFLEKQRLEVANNKSNQQLEKLNQELVKTRQILATVEDKNQALVSEINELKIEKIRLETIQSENNLKLTTTEKTIGLLEDKLANTKQSSKELQRLLRQKSKLIYEKKQLLELNKKSSQQLTNLIDDLNQKSQVLSQLENNNPALMTFIDNYEITPCTQVKPIVEKRLVPATVVVDEMIQVVTPVSVLVPTGKQFSVCTENWEEVHIADELTPAFYLQPKLSIM